MTLSSRMRWTGPPLGFSGWLEDVEISAGRMGVLVAAVGDLASATSAYASCVCEFAAGVADVGGDDGGGGPDPDPLPPWDAAWGCAGRTTVLFAPASGWVQRVLPNGNPVADQYWNNAVIIGGELVTAGALCEAVTIDIDGTGNQPSQGAQGLYVQNQNYTIPQTACMRADGTYSNGRRLFFQRYPLAGNPLGSTNDLDFNIPQFAYNLPNINPPDPGLMNSPGSRVLRAGYAYVLFCQVAQNTTPDFDIYWGF